MKYCMEPMNGSLVSNLDCITLNFPPAGVFLIIYFISMIFCGIPIFLLEVAIGQYLGSGGMTAISQLVPILKGLVISVVQYRVTHLLGNNLQLPLT